LIPKAHILEWASKTLWPEEQQVEQELLLCRALVAIFSDDFLSSRLAFRGGTALNKIFFSDSEDIDFVQAKMGANLTATCGQNWVVLRKILRAFASLGERVR
jgi:predicted nucleotidyltransferase component of viral defense system